MTRLESTQRSRIARGATRPGGFSLVELMVTITLFAIVTTMAMPTFISFIKNNRLSTSANDFLASLQTARSEAVKRGLPVTVCASSDPTDAVPQCTTASGATAWIVYWSTSVGVAQPASAANIIEVHPALPTKVKFQTGGNQQITFASTGFPAAGVANISQAVFCDTRALTTLTPTYGRAVLISVTGHGTVYQDYTNVNAALTAAGGTCP